MRAIAVLLVIADHLLLKPPGGFVGVDVFFVISGYLITGLLVREAERTGTVSIRGFYARRVRRIVPAAATTLVVTCLAARLVYVGTRAHETLVDAGWAALSLANWHFASVGTDYFQAGRPASAVQHYWSLAVEEQFYLVWPLLILMVSVATRGRPSWRRSRVPLGLVLSALVVASFTWSMLQSSGHPTAAYFSTFARAWELGLGSLIAIASGPLARMPRAASRMLSWGGLGAVLLSAVVISPASTFPAPWGLLPVLGTAALIAGGSPTRYAPKMLILTNPVSRYIGRISYSLYLWHWPALTLLAVIVPRGALYIALSVALTGVLSVVSFHFVETPLRQAHSLPRRHAVSRRRALQVSGSTAMALSAALLVSVVIRGQAGPAEATTASPPAPPALSSTDGGDSLSAQIAKALSATAWPKLTPSVDDLEGAKAKEWGVCGNVSAATQAGCTFGPKNAPSSKRIVVLGDSIGISWMPSVRAGLEHSGWKITGLTFGQCPAPRLDVTAPQQARDFISRCGSHQSWALKEAVVLRPAIIVLAAAQNTLGRMPCCSSLAAAAAEWTRAETAAVTTLKSSGAKIVILSPPPETKNLADCATRFNGPSDCVADIDSTWYAMSKADATVVASTRVTYIDTHTWFCTKSGVCPPFVGNITISADGTHLTSTYATALGPLMAAALTGSKT